jgi:Domain of unknown function (DUF4194)
MTDHTESVLNSPVETLDLQADDRARALGAIVVPLLKGVQYRSADASRWLALGRQSDAVRDHLKVLGLELIVDEAEGYAFVRSISSDPDEAADDRWPRLVARRPLTFSVSLLLALLRRRLVEADAMGGDTRLVLTRSEIVDLVSVFLPTSSNEARVIDRVEADIEKVGQLGFLHKLGGRSNDEPRYEVRRVLKAFVDAQWLHEFDERLAEYRVTVEANGGRPPDDRKARTRSRSADLDADAEDPADSDEPDDNEDPAR